MKITLIANSENFCTKELKKAAKKEKIHLDMIDFLTVKEAKNYQEWGDIIIWRNSKLDKKIERNLLFNYLKSKGKIMLNLGQGDKPFLPSNYYQQELLSSHLHKTKNTKINVSQKLIEHCKLLYQRNTKSIEEVVYNYFDKNYDGLGSSKFHFSSRLYNFFKSQKEFKRLKKIEAEYIGDYKEKTHLIISNILSSQTIDNPTRNNKKFRDGILLKSYPMLSKYNQILFKFLFTKQIYKKNISKIIEKYVNIEDLLAYREKLLKNPLHICSLSTFAINYLYILDFFLKHSNNSSKRSLIVPNLLKIAKEKYKLPSLKNKLNLQLYFYTHCIIDESLFYSSKITKNKKTYFEMMKLSEEIIINNYFEISVDNKVEFLVCAKLSGYKTKLFNIIYSECKKSLSDTDNFLIDRQNKQSEQKLNNFLRVAEHRNVLFLMAFLNKKNFKKR
jgi:hypothetical protein